MEGVQLGQHVLGNGNPSFSACCPDLFSCCHVCSSVWVSITLSVETAARQVVAAVLVGVLQVTDVRLDQLAIFELFSQELGPGEATPQSFDRRQTVFGIGLYLHRPY